MPAALWGQRAPGNRGTKRAATRSSLVARPHSRTRSSRDEIRLVQRPLAPALLEFHLEGAPAAVAGREAHRGRVPGGGDLRLQGGVQREFAEGPDSKWHQPVEIEAGIQLWNHPAFATPGEGRQVTHLERPQAVVDAAL